MDRGGVENRVSLPRRPRPSNGERIPVGPDPLGTASLPHPFPGRWRRLHGRETGLLL